MLDVQRNRGQKHREEIDFARNFMWGHMIFGAVVVVLFLFHEFFQWFAGAMAWYAVSLALVYGFISQRASCRWLLALVFFVGTLAGVYFITRVYPLSTPPKVTLLPHAFIPLWLGMANLIYVIGGLLMLFNTRIRRAGKTGFLLW
jgi:hypothetical protein